MRLLVLALTISLTGSGCSFFLTHGPSDPPAATPIAAAPAYPPACTDSMTWPAVDGAIAAVVALGLISAISNDKPGVTTDNVNGDSIGGALLVAGTATASAIVGYNRVSKCRKVTEQLTVGAYGPQPPYAQQFPQQAPQYPPQQVPPQQVPPPQYPPQQYPPPTNQALPSGLAPGPLPQPVAQPGPPIPQPVPKPAPAPAPKAQPKPAPQPDPALGTEGDVCTTQAECSTGLTCTSNVCLRPKKN